MALSNELTAVDLRCRQFAEAYWKLRNAKQAALAVGYSESVAATQAHIILRSREVQTHLREFENERREAVGIAANDIIREVAAVAFADLGEFVSWDANGTITLKASEEFTLDKLKAIKTIGRDRAGNLTVLLHDKMGALKMLGEYLGMWDGKSHDNGPKELVINCNLGAPVKALEEGADELND